MLQSSNDGLQLTGFAAVSQQLGLMLKHISVLQRSSYLPCNVADLQSLHELVFLNGYGRKGRKQIFCL